jgi:transposase
VAKGGLTAALTAVGITHGQVIGHFDEMRLGLVGTTRRRWGVRGVKIIQPIQRRYQWAWLVLLVDGARGTLWWAWQDTVRSDDLLGTVRGIRDHRYVDAIVWDGAPSHRERRVRGLGMPLVELPPYSPELNPAERVFHAVRRAVEGEVYATLTDKQAAVERYLAQLDADPERVRSLLGWHWLADALAQLSPQSMA